jgi:methylmalonyl-CoA mutase cobalamin-binding subunit
MAQLDEEDDLEFDRKVALKKVAEKGMLLAMFPEFQSDKEVVIAAIRQNPDAITLAHPSLQQDPQILRAVKQSRENGPEALHWSTGQGDESGDEG